MGPWRRGILACFQGEGECIGALEDDGRNRVTHTVEVHPHGHIAPAPRGSAEEVRGEAVEWCLHPSCAQEEEVGYRLHLPPWVALRLLCVHGQQNYCTDHLDQRILPVIDMRLGLPFARCFGYSYSSVGARPGTKGLGMGPARNRSIGGIYDLCNRPAHSCDQ